MPEQTSAADAACTGVRYSINTDAPGEGTDVHHTRPCPVHPGAVPEPTRTTFVFPGAGEGTDVQLRVWTALQGLSVRLTDQRGNVTFMEIGPAGYDNTGRVLVSATYLDDNYVMHDPRNVGEFHVENILRVDIP